MTFKTNNMKLEVNNVFSYSAHKNEWSGELSLEDVFELAPKLETIAWSCDHARRKFSSQFECWLKDKSEVMNINVELAGHIIDEETPPESCTATHVYKTKEFYIVYIESKNEFIKNKYLIYKKSDIDVTALNKAVKPSEEGNSNASVYRAISNFLDS